MRSFEFVGGYDVLHPRNTLRQTFLGAASIDGIQKPPPLSLGVPFDPVKKGLLCHPEDMPRTEYTEQDVAARLAKPSGFVNGSVFDGPVSDAGIKSGLGMKMSSWGRQRPSPSNIEEYYEGARRTRLDFMTASRKSYEGPIYLQGQNPTCNAWTGIHALLAAGVTLSPLLVKDLLNGALPREDGKGGISTFAVAGLIDEHCGEVAVNIPALSSGKLSVQRIATFVKDAIDASGAVLATVKVDEWRKKDGYHAICIPGYNLNEQGYMDVQVIDSACGVGALTVESLTRELSGGHLVPFAAVTKN